MTWTQADAIALCREIEMIAPLHGAHVALTGGCLYKTGERKDLDILFYRIRQSWKIDSDALVTELAERIGLTLLRRCSPWCWKLSFEGKPIDCFFPEEDRHGEHAERQSEFNDSLSSGEVAG